MEQPQRRKGKGGPPSENEPQELTTAIRSLLSMTLAACVVTISLYAFFGTGDEVQCGSGISSKVCYLPGPEWLGYSVAVSFLLVIVSFMFLSPKK